MQQSCKYFLTDMLVCMCSSEKKLKLGDENQKERKRQHNFIKSIFEHT